MTPFEIRLEILKLARDIVFEPAHVNRQAVMDRFYHEREFDKRLEFPSKLPSLPTTEDVLAEADKLNEFISRQG